jgi:rsbT co-antagonist protein RsbR
MAGKAGAVLADILQTSEQAILQSWLGQQFPAGSTKLSQTRDEDTRNQSKEFVALIRDAFQSGDSNVDSPAWERVREFLLRLSIARAKQGFSSTETATFVFSLKLPIVDQLRSTIKDPAVLGSEFWHASLVFDRLGLYTIEMYQKGREEIIARQQQELLELSTPVVKLWDGILALPMIGTLDSSRTQVVMETLLERIVETESPIVIIDITGVPTVDTLVAQHLLKTVSAARLMGTECIISGIRPQIAQTIVHLGVDLGNVITRSTLADAIRVALRKLNYSIVKLNHAAGSEKINAAGKAE